MADGCGHDLALGHGSTSHGAEVRGRVSAVQDIALDARLLHLPLAAAAPSASLPPGRANRASLAILVRRFKVVIEIVVLVANRLTHRGCLSGTKVLWGLREVTGCLSELRMGSDTVLRSIIIIKLL